MSNDDSNVSNARSHPFKDFLNYSIAPNINVYNSPIFISDFDRNLFNLVEFYMINYIELTIIRKLVKLLSSSGELLAISYALHTYYQ